MCPSFFPSLKKVCVPGGRKYRISTGSGGEFILMIALGLVAWSGGYIGSRGGFRAILRSVMGSYDLAVEHYQRACGNKLPGLIVAA
ncbi:hypothetical protein KJ693_04805 [bacterium]|nr:hypothetical protein [bacterium]MBU1614616.1 hypothetical protein [bacterium]